jgi:hypothetical protein
VATAKASVAEGDNDDESATLRAEFERLKSEGGKSYQPL